MQTLHTSSGDLTADRRADYAEMLYGSGDPRQRRNSCSVRWNWRRNGPWAGSAWARCMRRRRTRSGGASLGDGAETRPGGSPGRTLKLQLIGKAPAAAAPPSAFVETLFDHYAESFEGELVDKLGYRLPEFLARAIRAARPGRFSLVLDLGCGTGLMGEKLRPITDRLEGCDISAAMLKKARAKGVYDLLAKADLQHFAYAGPKADLVVAADVFIYVGALDRVVKTVAGILATNGLFAFSARCWPKARRSATPVLRCCRLVATPILRAHVERVLAANGLSVLSMQPTVIRWDRGQPVDGLAVYSLTPSSKG